MNKKIHDETQKIKRNVITNIRRTNEHTKKTHKMKTTNTKRKHTETANKTKTPHTYKNTNKHNK